MNITPINDGGPAFPRTQSDGYLTNSMTKIDSVGGMSLRAWLAGQALAGIMANPSIIAPRPDCGWGPCNCTFDELGALAVAQADSVLNSLGVTK